MEIYTVLLMFILVSSGPSGIRGQDDEDFLCATFPPGFNWGLSTSAFQIEGGWNADGKGESIWDEFNHRQPSPIMDNSTGDVACDSYNKFQEDVQLLRAMGAHHYRFSISWSRILPTGKIHVVNLAGIEYYNKLIDELIQNGIEPMVTMYHWDLPQALQAEYGGWPNETLVQHFVNYADLLFRTYGDRVKKWLTFNEPWVVCILGYNSGIYAPGIADPNQPYQCAHTILKSHAKVYRLYHREYSPTQSGRVGISLDTGWYEPKNASDPAHQAAAARAIQFTHGWFGSPVFFGKYPDVMREYVDRRSEIDGVPSRLPRFSLAEESELRGSYDFLGLNHYTTSLVEPAVKPGSGWDVDQETEITQDPNWEPSFADWLRVVPWGFRKLLVWLKGTYGSPEIWVTENGFADNATIGLNDERRCNYYRQYINQMLRAMVLDGVKVTSYSAWSLVDNFEWTGGYTQKYGVHSVDMDDPKRARTPKLSAAMLRGLFADNGFPFPCQSQRE